MPKKTTGGTRARKSASKGASHAKGEPRPRQNVEDKLDSFADRFSKAMTDGVKKMEEAFDHGMRAIKDNPNLDTGKVKGFFTSSTGGAILVIIGFLWFFYAVGLFDKWIIPVLVMVLGFYIMYRYRKP